MLRKPNHAQAEVPSVFASLWEAIVGALNWSRRVYEVVRRHLETEPLVEPPGLDAAKVADELDRLRVASPSGLDRDADELLTDAPRAVLFIDDQGVDGDQVPCPLELTPRRHSDQPDDVAVTLGHDHLGRRRRRQLGDNGLRGHRPPELVEELADARSILRDGDAQRRIHGGDRTSGRRPLSAESVLLSNFGASRRSADRPGATVDPSGQQLRSAQHSLGA
jgi:hypothetical protein